MEKVIKGTSVELIKKWIYAMEQDIKKNRFYCVSHGNDIYATSLNQARLLIMNEIFSISDNDNKGGSWSGIYTWSKESKKEHQQEVMAYLQTMKALLEI